MTHRHPHFALTLHDDAELAAALGSAVTARETLAEWPLSCVQRVRTAGGGSIIYKAQAEPTVEPQFYAAAQARCLPGVNELANPPGPAALLLEDVAAPPLADLRVSPADAPGVVDAVLAAIAGIRGELPATADLTTRAGYDAFAAAMLDDLAALVEAGAFHKVSARDVQRIARATMRYDPLRRAPAYLHGDLRAENVFTRAGAAACPIIVDWQRPLRGPADLDRACLLESLGVDPAPYVGPEIVTLLALARIAWLAACARRWFPPGVETYDAQIADLAARLPAL